MSEPLEITVRLVGTLEEIGIPYHLGGSIASSIHGVPRQTHDADLVVELKPWQVPELVTRLESEFYVDAESIRLALRRGSSFNLVHLASGFKIDMFPRGEGAFDRLEFARHRLEEVLDDPPRTAFVKTPEDTVLRKLEWYRLGGMTSDRQWTDVLGVLRVQGSSLDLEYLRRWAAELGLTDLLERALLQQTGE